jgi:hypothetical protein
MEITKNFMWWMVMMASFFGIILFVILEMYVFVFYYFILSLISGYKYINYRLKNE